MKILTCLICLLIIPSICSAHSGQLINAVSNYLPFIGPMIAVAIAACKDFFTNLFYKFKNK